MKIGNPSRLLSLAAIRKPLHSFPCSKLKHAPGENRVGDFFSVSFSCVGQNQPQALEPHQAFSTTSTTTVSGVVYWLSKDPIGISGGLNMYAFCGNNPVNFVDPMGLDVIIINDSGAAGRNGHSGILVGNSQNGWFYFSKDGPGKNASQWFRTPADFISSTTSDRYNRGFYVPTTRQQDAAMIAYGLENWNKPYSVVRETDPATCETTSEDCADLTGSIMIAGGLPVTFPTDSQWPYKKFTDPNDQYEAILRTISGRNFNPNP